MPQRDDRQRNFAHGERAPGASEPARVPGRGFPTFLQRLGGIVANRADVLGLTVLGLITGYFPLAHYLMDDAIPSCPTAPIHGHTIMLSFVGMTIFGLAYHALPAWIPRREPPLRLVRLHFWLAVAGVIGVCINGTLELAVKAMQLGAVDFITKPFTGDHITVVINKVLEMIALRRQVGVLKQELDDRYGGIVGENHDRVVVLWSAFGRNAPIGPPFDMGRTVTHEVGHYLGLYHVFQDGCGTGTAPGCYSTGDRVCDTEPDETSHGGCPTNAMTCGDPDPIRNYLEYTDDVCMNNFTPEQARRMRCAMEHYRPNGYEELGVVGVDPAIAISPGGALEQNRPNPFASGTELAFTLARDGEAALVVHDLSGRVVKTLASGHFPGGTNRVRWDGTGEDGGAVPAGVYFYRLTTAEGVRTRRMVMIR